MPPANSLCRAAANRVSFGSSSELETRTLQPVLIEVIINRFNLLDELMPLLLYGQRHRLSPLNLFHFVTLPQGLFLLFGENRQTSFWSFVGSEFPLDFVDASGDFLVF